MREKNLLDLDLQFFAKEEVADVEESEAVEPTEETSEAESEETVEEESGNDAPPEQSAEENARYAAIRRRAEEDARRKYQSEIDQMNQQVAAMCQGLTHPDTGQPITNIHEYMDALQAQQRIVNERELEEKGVNPAIINRMIATNPVVMQAQQVIEQTKQIGAEQAVQRDIAELSKYDPNIKGINDLTALPNFPEMVNLVAHNNLSLVEAYKAVNFDSFMQHTNEAARQQAINQMRGKAHLPSQTQSVAQDEDYVEVPADIMARWKAEGKTEKQIRDLYTKVTGQLQ